MGVDDRKFLVGAALTIVLLAAPARQLLLSAWDSHRLIYNLYYIVVDVLNVDANIPAAIALGVIIAWTVLFGLTEGKRIQGIFLFVFLVVIVIELPWFRIVLTSERVLFSLLGGVIGGVIGAVGANVPIVQGKGRREFPTAARALYATVSTILLVALFER